MNALTKMGSLKKLQHKLAEKAAHYNNLALEDFHSDSVLADWDAIANRVTEVRTMKSRNASILAEMNKVAREQPYDGNGLRQSVNHFHRSCIFVTDVSNVFPRAYDVLDEKDIECKIIVKNMGINYCWGKDNLAPIQMCIAFSPSSEEAGQHIDVSFLEYCCTLDTVNISENVPSASANANCDYKKNKIFNVNIPCSVLATLDRREYDVSFCLYESELDGQGGLIARDLDFKGSVVSKCKIYERKG